jgi:hypothetical protein
MMVTGAKSRGPTAANRSTSVRTRICNIPDAGRRLVYQHRQLTLQLKCRGLIGDED